VKWNTLYKLLTHAANVNTPDDALCKGGNGLIRVERKDARLWDIMYTVNNKGTALSTTPGSIDFKAMQTVLFTKEAGRRPSLVMFFFSAVVRVAKARGQSRSRGRTVTDVAYQVQTICLQYQRMAELLLQRGPLSNVTKAKGDNSLEDLIWPYVVFNKTTLDMEAPPLPENSKGAALWAKRSAKWTMA
jgi:hypothetical protein